jgi:hypothetical protein
VRSWSWAKFVLASCLAGAKLASGGWDKGLSGCRHVDPAWNRLSDVTVDKKHGIKAVKTNQKYNNVAVPI